MCDCLLPDWEAGRLRCCKSKSLVFFRTQTFCSVSSRLHMSGLTFKRNIHDNLSYEDLNYGKIFNDPIHVSSHSMPTGTPHWDLIPSHASARRVIFGWYKAVSSVTSGAVELIKCSLDDTQMQFVDTVQFQRLRELKQVTSISGKSILTLMLTWPTTAGCLLLRFSGMNVLFPVMRFWRENNQ